MALAGRKVRSNIALAKRKEHVACGWNLKKGPERVKRRGSAACKKAYQALIVAVRKARAESKRRASKSKPSKRALYTMHKPRRSGYRLFHSELRAAGVKF